jgi:predicted ATP-binding protein involved in virulence
MQKVSSTIKRLVKKSDGGDFASSYQLFTMYGEGHGVYEIDTELAEFYRKQCVKNMAGGQFRIIKLQLENYKGFEDISIDFSSKDKISVFVGNNGSGKSSLLEALQKAMTHVSSRLATRSTNGDLIERFEIRKGSNYSRISVTYSYHEVNFSMVIGQDNLTDDPKGKSNYKGINELGQLFKLANAVDPIFNYPLLAAYTVERATDVTTKDIENSEEIRESQSWDKFKGYSKSLTGRADFKLFFRWLKELVEVENSDNVEIRMIKAEIKSKEKELDNPLLKAVISKSPDSLETKELLAQHNLVINHLKDKLNSYFDVNSKTLQTVENSIYSFLPGFSDLKFQRSPLDLLIKKGNDSFSVLQLSQGEKSILSLVADIARRLTLLNPSLENPLLGTGVVLIDEIDLHLHPSWQQKIVQRLQSTFENIQFIITTHSPQVCHTIDSDNITLLKDGKKIKAPRGTRGAVSSWVLRNLFEVPERPEDDEFTKNLNEYKKIVYSDRYLTPKAKQLYIDLAKHFGSDYDVLVELQLYIENREWEKGIENNN